MARKSRIAADARRRRLVVQYADRRAALGRAIRATTDPGEHFAAVRALARLPRDSSPVRTRNRDQVDGRPRAYLRKAGVSRSTFRAMAHRGELPGITKASW